MSGCKYKLIVLLSVYSLINFTGGIPTPLNSNNHTNTRRIGASSKFVEIKLPAQITTIDDLLLWIKNAMETMASRVDITLASDKNSSIDEEKGKNNLINLDKQLNNNEKSRSFISRNSFDEISSPWLGNNNQLFPPLISTDPFLPIVLDDSSIKFQDKYLYNAKNQDFSNEPVEESSNKNSTIILSSENENKNNNENLSSKNNLPYAIPFEAFITITREPADNNNEHVSKIKIQNIHQSQDSNSPNKSDKKKKETTFDDDNEKNEDTRKRQIAALGDLLKMLGLTGKPSSNKVPEASTLTSLFAKPTKKKIRGNPTKPLSFEFEDLPEIPDKNETSQRQEFDDDDDEEGGSLGSIADLLPLALPILEDLSNPESESDLIEVLEAAIPIIQGLSEADGDNGGVQDLINMIVPVVKKIVGGKNGQGSDLSAIVGPLFGLLAPFIGPVLAPVIGPLIRTISNPPSEGSSLAALITAISGPLSTPIEPSKMSPLSIVLAGTIAGLVRELKPGAPGGSDLGALISAILTGVISGTSAGLSGGSSGDGSAGGDHHDPGYAPYTANLQSPISSSSVNLGLAGRPSPGPLVNSPFFINRPNHGASTVNIGSTIRPELPRPTLPNYNNLYLPSTIATPQKNPSPRPIINHPGSFPSASTTSGNGGPTYLPIETSSVPAHTVNPIALIGDTIKDVLGAGGQIVTAFINAVVGLFGGSSQS